MLDPQYANRVHVPRSPARRYQKCVSTAASTRHRSQPLLAKTVSAGGGNSGLLVTGSDQHGCFAVVKIARHRGHRRADQALQRAGRAGARPTSSDRAFNPWWAAKVSKLARCSAVARCAPVEPLRAGQAGPHQVDGPAQVRVGFGLEAIGPGEAPVELVRGWSQCGHDPEGAVHAQLVRAGC